MFKGLSREDVHWVLRNKYAEDNGGMPWNKKWARKVKHNFDQNTKELVICTPDLEKELAVHFGNFKLGPIKIKQKASIKVVVTCVKIFDWSQNVHADEEQLKSIKARDWDSYVKNLNIPHQYRLDLCIKNEVTARHADCMAYIMAFSNGHVQTSVSDHIFHRNLKCLPKHGMPFGISKRTSKGISRITNPTFKLNVQVE